MTTLVEFIIIAGADNRPPMLEKSMYDSWKSRMELYIKNRENRIMILKCVLNGPLVWPTVDEENGTNRTKTYEELLVGEKLQADCDLKATIIVLQGLPPDMYAIFNHHKVTKKIWDRVKLLMQGTKLALQEKECKLYDEFDKFSFVKGETLPLFKTAGLLCNKFKGGKDKVMLVLAITAEDLDAYDSNYDDVSNAKAVLMANLSNYGFNVILEEKLSLKQQIDSLKQNLSNQIKEKESLLKTFTVFKNESKEKESKYMYKEIDLETKKKELDNIVYKVSQSAQTVHMLTKLQVFYNDTHKQALGYQNPFYLKKSQWIKPTLYVGISISSQHVASPVIDDEETLILEEVGRSKMLAK
uniref:Integrase, catalytic region, zinc finger, CCHC-type, peptidase aspartic, catalytic n=1 Tax=Tanacetum cinerariifolium TaxID=118510 RepID=A0A6L2LDG9_TANCI|nr:hypothetical protein [Tanacetum cinerariifolium]